MKTDRELLELAAKAAGLEFSDGRQLNPRNFLVREPKGDWRGWNPLTDDGDALRLAVKLEIEVRNFNGKSHAGQQDKFWRSEAWFPDGDPCAATRRCIVRAAAAIGEAKP